VCCSRSIIQMLRWCSIITFILDYYYYYRTRRICRGDTFRAIGVGNPICELDVGFARLYFPRTVRRRFPSRWNHNNIYAARRISPFMGKMHYTVIILYIYIKYSIHSTLYNISDSGGSWIIAYTGTYNRYFIILHGDGTRACTHKYRVLVCM